MATVSTGEQYMVGSERVGIGGIAAGGKGGGGGEAEVRVGKYRRDRGLRQKFNYILTKYHRDGC